MKIALAADHAGYELKERIKSLLTERGHEYVDFGTHSTAPVDYPDLALEVAKRVASGECDRGITVCGTGIGCCITANKVPGIRAAVCSDTFSARFSRDHNDVNILCLGARVLGSGLAQDIVETWLRQPFSEEERHRRRVNRIREIEDSIHD
jgi:ribose 5-phosphate isomerase B